MKQEGRQPLRQPCGRRIAASPDRTAGFTLIELLVVVSIIALLVSILLPALGKAREQARSVLCMSNLRQLMLAQIYYADEYGVFAAYYRTGNPPIHFVQDFVGMDFSYSAAVRWEPAGTIINIPPYVCPNLPPAVKTAPAGDWRHSDGNPYPYGWNGELGLWFYQGGMVTPHIAPERVRRPAEIIGWADAMNSGSGMFLGPGRWWYTYWRPPAPRHGGGFKGLEDPNLQGLALLSPELYPSGSYANGVFVDGHVERVTLDMILNPNMYRPQ